MADTVKDHSPKSGRWRRPALAFVCGVGLALGHVPISLFYIALPAFVGLFFLMGRSTTPREALKTGWAGGLGYFLLSLFWIVEPFFIDPEQHAWMAPFAVLLLPSFLGSFWALAFWAAARLAKGWQKIFLAAVFLAIAETSRAYVFTGFPWALIGYIWVNTPIMQTASLIGPHGLTLLTSLLAAAGAVWFGRSRKWLTAPALATLVFASLWIWGVMRIADPLPPRATEITLRIVQPNAEQSLKWDPNKAQEFLNILIENTGAPATGKTPDLVLWPETSYPYLLNGSDHILARMDAAAGGKPIAFGSARRDGPLYFNSLVITDPGGEVAHLYDKFHLVPFGEYIPFGDLLGRLGIKGLAVHEGNGFAFGPAPRVIDLGPLGKMQPLICYEAIFPQHSNTGERADWLFHLTNDAWFGVITGPYQHLAQVQMRAVEQGLPVIRSANTGVSAVITAYGQVTDQMGLGERGFIDTALPPALPPTLYARSGDIPIFLLLILLSLGLILPGYRKAD